jgi:MurNAc alpha-1-phosphate uridylyltransferase
MKAMILAAGRGERMRPLTDSLPKPLLAVGASRSSCTISKAHAGVTDLVINHAWLGHKLVGSRRWPSVRVDIQWSAEESALETAGGIVQALPLLGDEPFLVINGDTWLDLDYRTLVTQPLGTDPPTSGPKPPASGGDFAAAGGQGGRYPALTFSGVGLYDPAAFAGLAGARKLAPLLRDWMAQGRVGGSLLAGEWRDIGTVALGCRRWTSSCSAALINFTRS